MISVRVLLLGFGCCVWMSWVTCEDLLEIRSVEDFKTQEEKDLIDALQEVLQKLKNKQIPTTEKKLGWVQSCDAGEQCAIRKGARIGKLCSCPRGTSCSFNVLKCL
ncbi:cocaine- and amphetamine-regulated transcript protein [Sardina pilchardus]|uniref:cocaine- and amphetamine-regulated transcript protein n=1 Tax=Sardina pilchardus TaxID=27697 RepID=UPI002E1482DC